jgi:UDP:flavonoid glycosyltransferase YjiC (YdhE family)
MKILIASIPAAGHLNPLLSIASLLVESGHEVAVQVNEDMRPAVESAGHRFLSEIPNAQTSGGYYFDNYPERMQKSPGMEMTGYDFVHFFARNIAAQSASLKMALYDFPADLILADSIYWGTFPMLVGPRDKRPAIAHLGVSVVNIGSGKNIPMRPDETPEQREAELERRERFMLQPAQQAVNAVLGSLDYPTLPCPILEAMTELSDLYLHPGIESFEYPDSNSKVQYIGALPTPASHPTLPAWWQHLDRTKRLVLVTQGTVANRDFGQVIAPALVALGGREDVTIIVTAGGQPVESICPYRVRRSPQPMKVEKILIQHSDRKMLPVDDDPTQMSRVRNPDPLYFHHALPPEPGTSRHGRSSLRSQRPCRLIYFIEHYR